MQATRIGSIWELFQTQLRMQFDEQLLRLDEVTAQIQQACESLPEPERYEAFCDEFQSELQHSVERIQNLRERGARPLASSQIRRASIGRFATLQQSSGDMDEGLEGAKFRAISRRHCLSTILEEEGAMS
ncbi:uncharacterized protein BO80DRAFT_445372 [Aspergillus ibericus CBS 121593]|uniref:Uncharacterized protein n=1 Tax=Aspergillus ibericus CBS 121593 TaxID=1448316 RepID=A0A395H006_9EURO|nr:hypothetical protein BO80DRAFT_445372 [Aspergillus ibericus CBS 121593]RAL00659.1 hypothetical protein BO80DRAFT_445372 [Aspergillus ibericus CBS 121593]